MSLDVFHYENDQLSAAGVPLAEIARAVPTPFYVYDPAAALARFRGLSSAFEGVPHLHCVALKANSQPALLRPLFADGAGAEVVSGAELALARALGLPGSRIVFSGVGKTDRELASGIEAEVLLFLVESETELRVLDALAREAGRKPRVALRLNPDIDAKTHPHIATGVATAKFGIDPDEALRLYRSHRDFENLDFAGVHSHIGSQITELGPLVENARALSSLVQLLALSGVAIRYVDIGGGLGIPYRGEATPALEAYAEGVAEPLRDLGVTLLTEPGRVLFGPVGALVARVLYVKRVHGREFVVLDAGLNDSPAARSLRGLPSRRPARPARARRSDVRRGGRGLRELRCLRPRPRASCASKGRASRDPRRRSLRVRHELELQPPSSTLRSRRRGRRLPCRA